MIGYLIVFVGCSMLFGEVTSYPPSPSPPRTTKPMTEDERFNLEQNVDYFSSMINQGYHQGEIYKERGLNKLALGRSEKAWPDLFVATHKLRDDGESSLFAAESLMSKEKPKLARDYATRVEGQQAGPKIKQRAKDMVEYIDYHHPEYSRQGEEGKSSSDE